MLTGKYYFKNTLFGVILYIEYKPEHTDAYFRKATLADIGRLNIVMHHS